MKITLGLLALYFTASLALAEETERRTFLFVGEPSAAAWKVPDG